MQVAKSTCHPQLTEHEIDRIIAEYQDGNTIPDIASKHDRCYTTILNQLRKAGMDTERNDGRVMVTKLRRPQRYLDQNEINRLIAGYQAGATIYELAAQFGYHRQTVSRHLKANGVQMRLTRMTPDQLDEARRLYESGMTLKAVGQVVGVSRDHVRTCLAEARVELRSRTIKADAKLQ